MKGLRAAIAVLAVAFTVLGPIGADARRSDPGNLSPVASAKPWRAASVKVEPAVCDDWRRLKRGDVLVDLSDQGATKFVNGRILINQSPGRVWRVLSNPFEFEGKISPRLKSVEVLMDSEDRSVLKMKMEVLPPILPFINYTVESNYKPFEHVTFKRVAGSLKDFEGGWYLQSREDGTSCEVTYSMYVDPGVPVPQWLVRKAVRMELPRTLKALRDRINYYDTVAGAGRKAEPRSILPVHAGNLSALAPRRVAPLEPAGSALGSPDSTPAGFSAAGGAPAKNEPAGNSGSGRPQPGAIPDPKTRQRFNLPRDDT